MPYQHSLDSVDTSAGKPCDIGMFYLAVAILSIVMTIAYEAWKAWGPK